MIAIFSASSQWHDGKLKRGGHLSSPVTLIAQQRIEARGQSDRESQATDWRRRMIDRGGGGWGR